MNIEREHEAIAPQVGRWIGEQTRDLLGEVPSTRLQFAARDETGDLVGGVIGTVQYGVLHVHQLSTAPTHRRQGLGARLLAALEREALEHGATCALVDTLEFEAPGFYRKQGYTVLGVVGQQRGQRKYVLSKNLEPSQ